VCQGRTLFPPYLDPQQDRNGGTDTRKLGKKQVGFPLWCMEPQIHGVPESLWGPADDVGGRSMYRVGQGLILKTDSRHWSYEK